MRNAGQFRASARFLRPNLQWRAHRNQRIYFFDFCVRYRDAPVRPIHGAMHPANPRIRLAQSVNFNVAPRIEPQFARPLTVRGVWVGNMQRQVKLAVRILFTSILYSPSGTL